MTPEQLEKAMLDPASVFGTPENVVGHPGLTTQQKIDILLEWEYDASEEAVALEEGMPGTDSDLLRRVLLALGQLAGPIDVEHTGPTKQHGLPRSHVRRKT
jgi:hypothetical protein